MKIGILCDMAPPTGSEWNTAVVNTNHRSVFYIFHSLKPRNIHFPIMEDKENQQMFTFEMLEAKLFLADFLSNDLITYQYHLIPSLWTSCWGEIRQVGSFSLKYLLKMLFTQLLLLYFEHFNYSYPAFLYYCQLPFYLPHICNFMYFKTCL